MKYLRRYFYEVNYSYIDAQNGAQYFSIGYFSDRKNALQAIENVKYKPGFRDSKGAFHIEKFAVNFQREINKNEVVLYELSHEYLDSDGYDCFAILGMFATEEEADNKRAKLEQQHPYSENVEGFLISECKINVCGWTEGFTKW